MSEDLVPGPEELNDLPVKIPPHAKVHRQRVSASKLLEIRSMPPQVWAQHVAGCIGASDSELLHIFNESECGQGSQFDEGDVDMPALGENSDSDCAPESGADEV